jgi:hypothetical protein
MASRDQIADLINDCWAYFKTTSPPVKTIESWAGELLDLDLWNSGEWIRRKFKMLDDWPRNFPKTIRALYWAWRREQPKEIEDRGCSKCLSGSLHAKKDGYSFAFRCGHCNSSPANYHTATRYQLEEQGYDLDWQHDYDKPVDREFMGKIKGLLKAPVIRQESYPEEVPF